MLELRDVHYKGILVAKQCYDSVAVTIPVCSAGRSGNLTASSGSD